MPAIRAGQVTNDRPGRQMKKSNMKSYISLPGTSAYHIPVYYLMVIGAADSQLLELVRLPMMEQVGK